LFAEKGYTETSVRELAAIVGITEASIYNHFSSKSAMMEYILKDYATKTAALFNTSKLLVLRDNPTPEGILSCLTNRFPQGEEEHYLKALYVILQEQHRNPIVRDFVVNGIIRGCEERIKMIIDTLKEYGHIRPEADGDYWAKLHSCVIYAFANRAMLGIKDYSPDYVGLDMNGLLLANYKLLFQLYGVKL
jgi:AcrR family transcriptional regulator